MSLTRRRLLMIAASAVALPRLAAASPVATWQGLAFGARAEVALAGFDAAEAAPLFAQVERELARLEAIFSLYRADSSLSRLNREGRLAEPPAELLELLAISASTHARTAGVFDPTVQPLFALYAETPAPGQDRLDVARGLVGFGGVNFGPEAIVFARKGMALTLNGIAQGYATDRIRALLAAAGLRDIVVDIGEVAALGPGPAGDGWPVRLPDGSRHLLRDGAVATSARSGTLVGGRSHIFRPDGQESGPFPATVSVIARSAAIADALSTAMAIMAPAERRATALTDCQVVTT
jgi:thiamine biosynthesis lipoprotein